MQWLITLGPILWNFKELTMRFHWQGISVTWKGLQPGQVLLMSKKQTAKVQNSSKTGVCVMMITDTPQKLQQASTTNTGNLPLDLQQLLQSYSAVFELPKGLPPVRDHDH